MNLYHSEKNVSKEPFILSVPNTCFNLHAKVIWSNWDTSAPSPTQELKFLVYSKMEQKLFQFACSITIDNSEHIYYTSYKWTSEYNGKKFQISSDRNGINIYTITNTLKKFCIPKRHKKSSWFEESTIVPEKEYNSLPVCPYYYQLSLLSRLFSSSVGYYRHTNYKVQKHCEYNPPFKQPDLNDKILKLQEKFSSTKPTPSHLHGYYSPKSTVSIKPDYLLELILKAQTEPEKALVESVNKLYTENITNFFNSTFKNKNFHKLLNDYETELTQNVNYSIFSLDNLAYALSSHVVKVSDLKTLNTLLKKFNYMDPSQQVLLEDKTQTDASEDLKPGTAKLKPGSLVLLLFLDKMLQKLANFSGYTHVTRVCDWLTTNFDASYQEALTALCQCPNIVSNIPKDLIYFFLIQGAEPPEEFFSLFDTKSSMHDSVSAYSKLETLFEDTSLS